MLQRCLGSTFKGLLFTNLLQVLKWHYRAPITAHVTNSHISTSEAEAVSLNISGEKAATRFRLDHSSIWASHYMRWRLSNWEQLKGSPVKLGIVFLLSNVSFSLSIFSPMSVQFLHILQGVERLLPIQEASIFSVMPLCILCFPPRYYPLFFKWYWAWHTPYSHDQQV